MKYVVWVSLDWDNDGEYDGVYYDTLEEAKKVERVAKQEPGIVSTWIEERLSRDTQYMVHDFSTESVVFRGTEMDCLKYINANPERELELYWAEPGDRHYKEDNDEI